MLTSPNLTDDRLAHAFFTREGGVSDGVYSGLNCGPGSGDDAARVNENRRRAMAMIGLDAGALRTVHQIHSADVIVIDDYAPPAARPKADAMVTRLPGIALGILTADCVPLLFADVESGVIGAAHSGWKGTLNGIGAKVVEAMVELGATRGRIEVAIGPAIAQRSYEVGPEFPAPFLAVDPAAGRFFIPSERAGHFMFDLSGFVRASLENLKIGGISHLAYDTCTEERLFYSYRRMTKRGEADYGRQLSAIALKSGETR